MIINGSPNLSQTTKCNDNQRKKKKRKRKKEKKRKEKRREPANHRVKLKDNKTRCNTQTLLKNSKTMEHNANNLKKDFIITLNHYSN